jgi:predicted Zn-dependent protease
MHDRVLWLLLVRPFSQCSLGSQQTRPIEFLSTHPSPENRLGYIEEKIMMNRLKPEGLRIAPEDYKKNVLDQLK